MYHNFSIAFFPGENESFRACCRRSATEDLGAEDPLMLETMAPQQALARPVIRQNGCCTREHQIYDSIVTCGMFKRCVRHANKR